MPQRAKKSQFPSHQTWLCKEDRTREVQRRMCSLHQPTVNTSTTVDYYLEEDSSDIGVALPEIEVSSGVDEETGIEDSKQNDENNVRLETADKEEKDNQTPRDQPNPEIRVETLAGETLRNVTGWRIRSCDSGGDEEYQCNREPKDSHETTVCIVSRRVGREMWEKYSTMKEKKLPDNHSWKAAHKRGIGAVKIRAPINPPRPADPRVVSAPPIPNSTQENARVVINRLSTS